MPPAVPSVSLPEEDIEQDFTEEIRNILYGQQVKVDPSGVADIGDPYDFSSIFGNIGPT